MRDRPAAGAPTTEPTNDPFALRLEWFCVACGWRTEIDAPGFAGDGRYHYPSGDSPGGGWNNPCGPLLARRVLAAAGVST